MTYSRFGNAYLFDAPDAGQHADGVVTDSAGLQSAINAAAGSTLLLPTANYVIDDHINIPNNTTVGWLSGPYDSAVTPSGLTASAPTFLVPNSSVSPVQFTGRNACLSGVMFYYPNQVAPTSATPTSYPATITTPVGSAGNVIRNCTIANGYTGLQLYGGRHLVENCKLGCFSQPLIVDHSLDRIWLQNIHSGPFWNPIVQLSGAQTIDSWVAQNQTVLTVGRADDLQIVGLFAFSAAAANGNVGMSMVDGTDSPSCSYGDAYGIRFDTFSTGISCKATQAPGWTINGYYANCSTANVAMPSGGSLQPKLTINGGSWWGSNKGYTNAAGGLLDVVPGSVRGFNPRGSVSPPNASPVSTTVYANNNAVPCVVTVTAPGGGSGVTAVTIGGTATGITVAQGTQAVVGVVMPNQGISLTWSSGQPTWTWFGL